ncbi:hypothetical protein Q9189_007110, partial [Teloschistes chrysophthalmus]
MRCSLFLLLALTTTLTTSLSLPSIYQSRSHVPFPGPIPYPGKIDAPFRDSINTYEKSYGGLDTKNKIQQANLTDCLTAYGSNEHYDSWAGMECGGFGWFKGPENDTKIGTYDCYATCAWYSFVGSNPRKVIKTGPGHGPEADPLPILQEELEKCREAVVPGLDLPPLTGGAIGYVGYDCVRYFEPRTARPMKDVLQVPESLFMLFDTIVGFDHAFSTVKIITYMHLPPDFNSNNTAALREAYDAATRTLTQTISILQSATTPLPPQPPIPPQPSDQSTNIDRPGYISNIGRSGYCSHVRTLKTHIHRGDIFQAVPSHRLTRTTALHPFNLYTHLRTVNPSPYLFYISCSTFHLVGASPELLAKSEQGRIITHPIAGTVPRGKTPQQDEQLADDLRASEKDRAEHVMLVDLARNDINRVCDPHSTRVDRLMVVEKFSHVQHLVSQVSGVLRPHKTRFDAFRSIFPAGTVSGAPKVRAMSLIAELEREKRGVYAGAVGYFGYGSVAVGGQEREGAMDTCIALRTMVVKGGEAFLQAGGGIVFDSVEGEEWVETMNKLGGNI